MSEVPKATIGRIVHYSYGEHDLDETHKHLVGRVRPAIVVQDWGGGSSYYNLQVFTDGSNDGKPSGLFWATSRVLVTEPTPGAAHWPPRG